MNEPCCKECECRFVPNIFHITTQFFCSRTCYERFRHRRRSNKLKEKRKQVSVLVRLYEEIIESRPAYNHNDFVKVYLANIHVTDKKEKRRIICRKSYYKRKEKAKVVTSAANACLSIDLTEIIKQ